MPRRGNLALISQSGAIAAGMVDWAAQKSVGFSGIISIGVGIAWILYCRREGAAAGPAKKKAGPAALDVPMVDEPRRLPPTAYTPLSPSSTPSPDAARSSTEVVERPGTKSANTMRPPWSSTHS